MFRARHCCSYHDQLDAWCTLHHGQMWVLSLKKKCFFFFSCCIWMSNLPLRNILWSVNLNTKVDPVLLMYQMCYLQVWRGSLCAEGEKKKNNLGSIAELILVCPGFVLTPCWSNGPECEHDILFACTGPSKPWQQSVLYLWMYIHRQWMFQHFSRTFLEQS